MHRPAAALQAQQLTAIDPDHRHNLQLHHRAARHRVIEVGHEAGLGPNRPAATVLAGSEPVQGHGRLEVRIAEWHFSPGDQLSARARPAAPRKLIVDG